MVELQSSNGVVNNASSQQEVRVEPSACVIARISAELQEEKQRNAELMERISKLEALLQEQETLVASLNDGKRFKRQRKLAASDDGDEERRRRSNVDNGGLAIEARPREERLVKWIHVDEALFLQGDKLKDDCFDGERGYTEESDDDDEGDTNGGHIKPGFGVHIKKSRESTKLAFCPKEVRRIFESKSLLVKNAECHTIRKILVFACLGVRHGCDEMLELDFTHFNIVKKGELEEHVVYENPGTRQRKIFYPNGENPTLCPVEILEEEKAMRPCDESCPNCLFLCIKYGGRTRNLPQNEYVRQHMGRNKLTSLGPLICRMANLAHIRSGSFFFKALGITTLFMAGFPHHLVQKETLDLLWKYYRLDEDAGGEELFLLDPVVNENQTKSDSEKLPRQTTSKKKRKGEKKPQNSARKPPPPSAKAHSHVPDFNQSPAQTTTPNTPMIPLQNGPNQRPISPYPFPPMMYYWSPPPAAPNNPFPMAPPYAYPFFPPPNFVVSSMNPPPYYGHPAASAGASSMISTAAGMKSSISAATAVEGEGQNGSSGSTTTQTKQASCIGKVSR